MYEIAVGIHIVSMIASVLLMSGAVILGVAGKHSAVTSASWGMYATIIGFISGLGLLVDNPLSPQCAGLMAYVVAVTILYRVGYGAGEIAHARLVRAATK